MAAGIVRVPSNGRGCAVGFASDNNGHGANARLMGTDNEAVEHCRRYRCEPS
jgi:hypothetical protein